MLVRGIMIGVLRKIILPFVIVIVMGGTAARGTAGEIVIDNGDSGTSTIGAWMPSAQEGAFGEESLWGISGSEYTWHAALPETGIYEVYLWWTTKWNRATDAPIEILTSDGPEIVRLSQRVNGGRWNLVGPFPFTREGGGKVSLIAEKTSHWIFRYLPEWLQPVTYSADAVKFVLRPSPDDDDDQEPGGGGSEPAENEKPAARIDGISFSCSFFGNPVNFRGAGEDPDGTIASYAWHSSLDGDLSREPSFTTSNLSQGRHRITLKVRDNRGAWSDPVEEWMEVRPQSAAVEQIFLCLGYSGTYNRPAYETWFLRVGAVDRGTYWEITRPDRGKTFLLYLVEDKESMKTALMTEKAHVIYEGHSNYGLGGLFATTEETIRQKLYDVLYIDDDRIFNYSSPWVNVNLRGLRTQQAFPFWWPVFKDGTSGIMPYDFGDPRGNPPYNYWITYRIPGDPVLYKLETAQNGGLDRFFGSDVPAWYDPDGKTPDPENPEHRQYFMTNTRQWVPSVRMEGDWNEAFVHGDCYNENYYWTEAGTGEKMFSWLFSIPRAGLYAIDGWWCTRPDSTDAAIYRVNHAGGTTAVAVNQRENGGQWNRLGEYYFEPGDYSVDLSDDIPSGVVAADAVRVNHVDNPPEILQANFYGLSYRSESLTYYYFVDQSTGLYTSLFWNFGDGTTNNTREKVLHEYTKPGEYTVSLSVSGESGTSTIRKEKYAFVGDDESRDGVRVDYSARNRDGTVPLRVRFSDQSFGDFRQWRWDFGDGSPPAFEQNPDHLYDRPGNYTVTLTAVDGSGRLISERKENLVRAVFFEETIDNMDYPKTHDGGKLILYGGEPEIGEEDLRFSRLFYYGCNSGNYYLGTFHRGVIFYTVNLDMTGAVFSYLEAYLDGSSDHEVWEAVQKFVPVFDYYDFSKRPWEQEGQAVGSQGLREGLASTSSNGVGGRRMLAESPAGGILSVDLDDGMAELAGGGLEGRRSLLVSEISQAFEETRGEALARSIGRLGVPGWVSPNTSGSSAGSLLLARGLFEAFPQEAVELILRAYETGTNVLRGNLILAAGALSPEDRRIVRLLLAALSETAFIDGVDGGEDEGTPLRICDLAYNQIVLHLRISGVLRTLGAVHSIETRDHHIAILKERLGDSG